VNEEDFLGDVFEGELLSVVVGSLKWKMRNEGSPFLARDTAAASPPIFSCHFSKFFNEQARISLPHNLKMMFDGDERGSEERAPITVTY
jgi:hypothetical protein